MFINVIGGKLLPFPYIVIEKIIKAWWKKGVRYF